MPGPAGDPRAVDNVDTWRGPTASQAAGLTLGAARLIVAAVQAEARAMGVAMSCAVVDSGDQLVAFERMDAADLVGITLARDKAFTALVNRMPSGEVLVRGERQNLGDAECGRSKHRAAGWGGDDGVAEGRSP